jgi:hypothetical protein
MGVRLPAWAMIALIVGSGALVAYLMLRLGRKRGLGMIALGHALAAVALFLGARQGSDWQSAGYIMVLYILVLPSAVGLALGSVIGWLRGPQT